MTDFAVYRGKAYLPVYIDREVLLAQLDLYQPSIDYCPCGAVGKHFVSAYREGSPPYEPEYDTFWLCTECYISEMATDD